MIANKGGSRSSKTFSALQLWKFICENDKDSINTVVSHSFPHLEGGAIRDFEKILADDGYNVDALKHVAPRWYKIGSNIIEFVGFDNPGKALGGSRKRLFINEANKMPHSICHQLMQRTTETIFLDWNPSDEFWFETEGYDTRSTTSLITSTFLDNYNPLTGKTNLSDPQIEEFYQAKLKAEAEDRTGKRGYWWNWWRVYGHGLRGQLEGIIFQNWTTYKDLPDTDLYRLWGVDWGGLDPTVLIEVNFDGDNNAMYIREHVYQPQILNTKMIAKIEELNPGKDLVICDSARKDKIFELQMAGIKAIGATKGEGSIIDGIERLQEFQIYIHENSANAIDEFGKYKRVQDKVTGKYLDVPEDSNNHIIDACRYSCRFYRKSVRP